MRPHHSDEHFIARGGFVISMRLSEAAEILGGTLVGEDRKFQGVSTDTRSLDKDELFFALKGPRFDAQEMLSDALSKGACGAVSSKVGHGVLPVIRVKESRVSLGVLAGNWRRRFDIPLVGVTGSAGKTSVKEMLGYILSQGSAPLITEGNLNNDIGLPLTLFNLSSSHNYAVIEMGASNPKDIEHLCSISRPSIGVITLCAPSHLDGFGDLKTVAVTKGEIIANLPQNGVAVINNEDSFCNFWQEIANERTVIRFGKGGDIYASHVDIVPGKIIFKMNIFGIEAAVNLNRRGVHNVNNALAAAGAAYALGVDVKTIVSGLENAPEPQGRLNFIRLENGLNLLNDTYNANPISTRVAIDTLAFEEGERWMVFGDMKELGEDSAIFHAKVGEQAAKASIDRLYTVGKNSQYATDSFGSEARHFENQVSLTASLVKDVEAFKQPVTILVKGSRSMNLELVTAALSKCRVGKC